MTEKSQPDFQEALSALKDGEATEWELRKLLQHAEDNADLYQRWKSYQLIGSSLRRENQSGSDISQSVSARLAEEKAGVAGWLITARKPLTQTAIAASVAAVAVMGMQQYQLASMSQLGGQTEIAVNTNLNPSVPLQLPAEFSLPSLNTRTVNSNSPVQVISTRPLGFDPEELKRHFEDSLYNHSQNTSEATQLVLPQARIPQSADQE
jgi:negative regulator of sigma E activity